jgi:hypothetical protein
MKSAATNANAALRTGRGEVGLLGGSALRAELGARGRAALAPSAQPRTGSGIWPSRQVRCPPAQSRSSSQLRDLMRASRPRARAPGRRPQRRSRYGQPPSGSRPRPRSRRCSHSGRRLPAL